MRRGFSSWPKKAQMRYADYRNFYLLLWHKGSNIIDATCTIDRETWSSIQMMELQLGPSPLL